MIVFDIFIGVLEIIFFIACFYFRYASSSKFIYLKGKNEYFDIVKPGKLGFVTRPALRKDIKKALKNADDPELKEKLIKRLKQKNYFVYSLLLFFIVPLIYLWIKAAFNLF